jgi:ATP-grasp ribosomal peptide maturase
MGPGHLGPVLVLAEQNDLPTDRVVKALTDRGVKVFRMDTCEFPLAAALEARIGPHRPWSGSLTTAVRGLDLASVRAAYYRTPSMFRFAADMSEAERQFARAQACSGLGGIISALECRWMSHPAAMSCAEYKPVQLTAARRAGLLIPDTLITNRPESVHEFAAQVGGDIVVKPVASPVLIEGGQLKTVYTRRLDIDDLRDLSGIETTAHLFQAWVPKTHEVRLTVVGDRMFAVEIHAGSAKGLEDWRSAYQDLRYEVTGVPDEIAAGVKALMKALKLRVGAIDFAVETTGTWRFFEVNPCGQWDWIQGATGLPIDQAIADELQAVPAS